MGPGFDVYAEAFRARVDALSGPRSRELDEAGLVGVVPAEAQGWAELLVHDDRGLDTLEALVADGLAGLVRLRDPRAPGCARLLESNGWAPSKCAAMVHPDLSRVARPPLPPGLRVRRVGPSNSHAVDEVPLVEAVTVAVRAADRPINANRLEGYLEGLLPVAQVFAAIDSAGKVRGTSAARVMSSAAHGAWAYVFFVNTDPGWQRRGVGVAMTAIALDAANATGAAGASLDASGAGARVYARLGFTDLGPIARYERSTEADGPARG